MFCEQTLMWIGIDDTDSTDGGCTTYLVKQLIQEFITRGYTIVRYPQLVRLNPNIPWKTRGNGAIALQITTKSLHSTMQIGEINTKKIFATTQAQNQDPNYEKIQDIIETIIENHAYLNDPKTNPGYVLFPTKLDPDIYEQAVHTILTPQQIIQYLKTKNISYKGYKNSRGLIGATAALAWINNHDKTYELITYREKKRWGTPRQIDTESVQTMDKTMPSTFDNYDYQNHHNRLTPNSPCPLLYGIRGNNPHDLPSAQQLIISEPIESWLLFETNQGTDDHIQPKHITEIQPYDSVNISGTVHQKPKTIIGGHVLFSLTDQTGTIDCAAYEPTKEFRKTILQLEPHDHIEVYGGVRTIPLTVNLEKIQVQKLIKIIEKKENPVCPHCGKHMKSQGKNQGYKCIKCKTKSNTPHLQEKPRQISPGYYEVPVCARRHLSKPIKRIKQPKKAEISNRKYF